MRSSFTLHDPRTRLSKINHVCFGYLATTSSLSAILTITHGKRVLFIKDVFKLWSISKDVGVLVGVLVQAVNTDHILKVLETVKWSRV